MKSKTDISSIARKLFRQNSTARRLKLMHPNRDWFVGVTGAIVIVVSMIGWSVYTYYEQREKISDTDIEAIATIPAYKADLVAQALDLAAQREVEFQALTTGQTKPVPTEVVEIVEPQVSASSTATSTAATEFDTSTENEAEVAVDSEVSVAPDQVSIEE